ncbi:hypothetical protein BDP27DRAFT_925015 [Rhodocollybia butyracea]|uniref:Uncharacterized protein n=1 Tax=Rhodocollybia butyracea TaxID=206335 RepID=A0A9P5PQ46_9AGAR|nr:hypothetical protein BDP27DRAFT_925015 [Rhodocollybia butyracea]
MFQHIAEVGASAITWDESTGRVCIAMQKNMKFLILDVRRDLPQTIDSLTGAGCRR